jgi:hypothetical protein
MIVHVVTFTFQDDVSAEQLDAIDAALRELPDRIEGLRSYLHGRDLRLREGTVDYAVVAVVDDADGLAGYLDHPAHVRAVQTYVMPVTVARQAVQIETAGL